MIPLEFTEFLSWRRNLTTLCDDFPCPYPNLPPPYDPLDFRFNPDSPCYAPSLVSSSIATAESLITQYKEVSSQLQLLQSNVQNQIQSFQQWTDNRKSIIAPIRLLSPDLIDLIMEHAASTLIEEHIAYDLAVCFSHVCSTWRSQALNYPFLWSKFIIFLFPIPKPEDMPHILDRIDIFASRSHPLPLDLTIEDIHESLPSEYVIDDIGLDIIVPPILESLMRISDRLRALDVPSTLFCPVIFPKMNFPLLQTITLSGTSHNFVCFSPRTDNLNAMILGAPQLHKFVLHRQFFCQWRDTKIPWENIDWLHISVRSFVFNVPVLSLTNLGTLSLVGKPSCYIDETFPTPLSLPLLNVLRIKDLPFLKRLETPHLTSFVRLEDSPYYRNIDNTIQQFLLSSGCSTQLTHLTLIVFPIDIPDVIDLLQLVTELEFLDLNGRVKDEDLFFSDEESSDDDDERANGETAESDTKHCVYSRHITEYLNAFTELFNVMTYRLPDPNLDNTSPSPVVLPRLKYLTIRSHKLFRPQFLTMIQSRSDPPHKLLRMELRLCKGPHIVTPEQLTLLLQDWDGMDELLQLMKDGKMDVRIYNCNSWE